MGTGVASGTDLREGGVDEDFYQALHDLLNATRTPADLTPEELTARNGGGENLVHWLLVESELDLAQALISRG